MAIEFTIMLLLVFFGALALLQQMKKNEVNAGSQDRVIKELLLLTRLSVPIRRN